MPRLIAAVRRVLPGGWIDLLRQLVLFCGAYWLYRLVRGLVDERAAAAFENARRLISLERALAFARARPAAWAWNPA